MITKDKKTEAQENTSMDYDVKVTRVAEIKPGRYAFDMVVNGIYIYGCFLVEGKTKKGDDFQTINFPSQKGKDGKYYNHAWFPINMTLQGEIEKQIEALL